MNKISALTVSCLLAALILPQSVVNAQSTTTTLLTVEATLEFGFFDSTQPSDPTLQEMDALMTRISNWWTLILRETIVVPAGSELESFKAEYLCHTFDAESDTPLVIDFDGKATFVGAGAQDDKISKWDVAAAMEGSNFQDFITNAVWTLDQSGGPLEEVNLAGFKSRDQNIPIACNHDNDSGKTEPVQLNDSDEPGSQAEETPNSESLCGDVMIPTPAAQTSRNGNDRISKDPVLFHPSCLNEQDCESGMTAPATGAGSLRCNFTLVTTGSTYNSDYPDCTSTTFEETKNLGELITIPLDTLLSDGMHQVVTPLTVELDTDRNFGTHENVTVNWGVGIAPCDQKVILFFGRADEGDSEYEVIGVEPLDILAAGGTNSISGSGLVAAGGGAIHRNRRQLNSGSITQSRRTHVGCTIGGFHRFLLEGSCQTDNPPLQDTGDDSRDSDVSSARIMLASTSAWFVSVFLLMILC